MSIRTRRSVTRAINTAIHATPMLLVIATVLICSFIAAQGFSR